ncbi:hypothetical protein H7H98_02770, partial [Mycolicibacterium sphagni]|nr:hypothetical protein [Mycolicibacterium sphagni]
MADENTDDADATEDATETETAGDTPKDPAGPRQVSLSVRTLLVGALVAVLAVAVGVLAWLYIDARGELDAQARQAANNERAQQVALDYAVAAAEMDYRDLPAWKGRLVAGTSPELSAKLGPAGGRHVTGVERQAR